MIDFFDNGLDLTHQQFVGVSVHISCVNLIGKHDLLPFKDPKKGCIDIFGFEETEPPLARVFSLHAHATKSKLDSLAFSISRKPDSDPPAKFKTLNKKFKGYNEAIKIAMSAIKDLPKTRAKTSLSFVAFPGLHNFCPPENKLETSKGGYTLNSTRHVYSKGEGESRVQVSITQDSSTKQICSVEIKAEIEVEFSNDCLNQAANKLWNLAKPIISHEDDEQK